MPTTITQAVSPGYIYTVTASSEAIVRDVETDKLLCKANNGSQGMFVAIGGTVSMVTDDPTATITQSSATSGGARFEVQQTRPDTGEEGVIYLIPITSSTEEENEYEEWIWVKGEWERLGTTGVNLSNYATLTGANTYSGDNTFNGLLLKKNSASLGDTSVLNRSEADARYGRLDANNTWSGEQYIAANGSLMMHPDAIIVAPRGIRGNEDVTWLSFNGLHLVGIAGLEASDVKTPTITTNVLHAKVIRSSQSDNKIDFAGYTGSLPADLSGINTLSLNKLRADSSVTVPMIETHTITPYAGRGNYIQLQDVNTIVAINTLFPTLDPSTSLSGVRSLKYKNNSIDLNYGTNTIALHGDLSLTGFTPRILNMGANGVISGVSSLATGNTKLILNDASKWGHTTLSNDLEFASPNNRLFVGHISGVQTLRNANVSLNFDPSFGGRIRVGDATVPLEVKHLSGVQSLQYADIIMTFDPDSNPARIHINPSTSLEVSQLSGVLSLVNNSVTVTYNNPNVVHGNNAMLVAAPEGINVSETTAQIAKVKIAPYKIEAFQLNADSFGQGKYGLRLTPDSCQLYGIDFAYGDVWSSYPMDGGALPAFLSSDTVKIMKPALTLYTTGVASLAFGEAPKVLFRTFPNGGGTAIFEFQAGYWSDDSHSAIVTGMVDLRKPSIPVENLHRHSLINKTELLYVVPIVTDKSNHKLAIGHDAALGGAGSVYITPYSNNQLIGLSSVVIGNGADGTDYSVAIGSNAEAARNGVAIGYVSSVTDSGVAIGNLSNSTLLGTGVGDSSMAGDRATALGSYTIAANGGVAIGHECTAVIGRLNLSTGGEDGARCSMLWYGGTSYDDRDNSGYLSFEIGNTVYNNRDKTGAQNDTVTISKPNLWSALDRAKYRGAQPYASYAASAVSNIPALEPNSITHIYTATNADIDLSDITLAQHDTAVTTAELWIEVTSAGATITWPDDMLWPDEADPTTAPSFSGPEESTEVGYTMQRLYCVTLRTQPVVNISTGNAGTPLLIATVAYTLDHKVPVA